MMIMIMAYVTKIVKFNAAHRLHNEQLSDAENEKIYSKCNNFHGHGHNYTLAVTLKGEVDPITGMIVNLSELKPLIEKTICDRFDHKHLNKDTEDFKHRVPTAENIAIVCWQLL